MADLLLELGVEEIPAPAVGAIRDQLRDRFLARLKQDGISHGAVECAATNRRLVLRVAQIPERTPSKEETVLGPAKRIALDDRGLPTVALKKFCEFQGVKLTDVVEIDTPKGKYLGITKVGGGGDAAELLAAAVPAVLAQLTFPKTMVWNESRVPFIRPLKSIVALFAGRLLDVEYAGVRAGNRSPGHLLLSDAFFEANSIKDYFEGLEKNFILLHEEERKAKILAEIREIEEDLECRVPCPDDMLDYYVYSNEYPVVFSGHFNDKYLALPAEIITVFMTHEKKLLPVYDASGRLTPHFVGVANIPDENGKVSRGNEKVVQAAFEDAQFFWDQDRKEDFFALKSQLKNVLFHKELGTYHEKVERLAGLVDFVINETRQDALRSRLHKAAFHCKNDLLTKMVREFPSLQGIMGGLYLQAAGEDPVVWKAIYGHYRPKGLSDEKLDDLGAGILSIADRMDNITGFIARGVKVSSSKDPYGIRRDAAAIVKIVVEFGLSMDLAPLVRLAALNFARSDADLQQIHKTVRELLAGRLEAYLKDVARCRYDVVNAVMAQEAMAVHDKYLKARALTQLVESGMAEPLAALHRRLRNILGGSERCPFSEVELKEKEERILSDVFKEAKPRIDGLILKRDYAQASSEILEMKPIIETFFEKILVMDKNPILRKNRIALLQRLDELLSAVADFSLLVETKPGGKS